MPPASCNKYAHLAEYLRTTVGVSKKSPSCVVVFSGRRGNLQLTGAARGRDSSWGAERRDDLR